MLNKCHPGISHLTINKGLDFVNDISMTINDSRAELDQLRKIMWHSWRLRNNQWDSYQLLFSGSRMKSSIVCLFSPIKTWIQTLYSTDSSCDEGMRCQAAASRGHPKQTNHQCEVIPPLEQIMDKYLHFLMFLWLNVCTL